MRLEGRERVLVALAILLATGGLAWATMDAGRMRYGVVAILAGFALRIALFRGRAE